VIVNEFGDTGLDHDLTEAVNEEVILMQSGCLCCSIRGNLSRTLHDLMDRRVDGKIVFDRLVIETTGLADPAPILQTLLTNHALSKRFKMNVTVTVTDAAAGPGTLDRQFEAVSQVAMADLIVVTKSDLVVEPKVQAFETRLCEINPTAEILRAQHGAVEKDALWGLTVMRQEVQYDDVMAWLSQPTALDPLQNLSGLSPSPEVDTFQSPHDTRISSAPIVLTDPIPVAGFDLWLDTLIALRGLDIQRVKGVVHLENAPTPFVFHGVQHLFEPPVPLTDWQGEDRTSRIVVIARDTTRPELTYSLDMLRAHQTQPTSETQLAGDTP
jgi:G3E family GTPase